MNVKHVHLIKTLVGAPPVTSCLHRYIPKQHSPADDNIIGLHLIDMQSGGNQQEAVMVPFVRWQVALTFHVLSTNISIVTSFNSFTFSFKKL